MSDLVERLEQHELHAYIPHACRKDIREAAARIEALEAQLAAREIALADETFKYAQAVHLSLLDVEIEDALKAVGIFTYGPDAERFELMFAAAMKSRRTLIEADAIASGAYKDTTP